MFYIKTLYQITYKIQYILYNFYCLYIIHYVESDLKNIDTIIGQIAPYPLFICSLRVILYLNNKNYPSKDLIQYSTFSFSVKILSSIRSSLISLT